MTLTQATTLRLIAIPLRGLDAVYDQRGCASQLRSVANGRTSDDASIRYPTHDISIMNPTDRLIPDYCELGPLRHDRHQPWQSPLGSRLPRGRSTSRCRIRGGHRRAHARSCSPQPRDHTSISGGSSRGRSTSHHPTHQRPHQNRIPRLERIQSLTSGPGIHQQHTCLVPGYPDPPSTRLFALSSLGALRAAPSLFRWLP